MDKTFSIFVQFVIKCEKSDLWKNEVYGRLTEQLSIGSCRGKAM